MEPYSSPPSVFQDASASTWSNADPPRPRRAAGGRGLAGMGASVLICAGYVRWRDPRPMLELRHIEHLGRESRGISINFDDAPHPVITPLLLASLKRADVKATFFVIGDGLQRYPELSRRLLLEGHALANHSQNHHNLSTVERGAFDEEILRSFETIQVAHRQFGVPNPTGTTRLFRPPGGGMNRDVMKFLWRNDVTLAWWSNNVGDWARPPAWKIFNGVLAHLRGGDIILLHDAPGGYGTPQAIPGIVRKAREQGLECVLMPESVGAGAQAK